jgi:hypothetical protein
MELRRIFRPEREKVERGQRRLHNEELHILYASPIVIRVIKLRRRNSTHRRGENCKQNVCGGRQKGGDHTQDVDVDERIMLEWSLGKQGGNVWTGLSGSG